MIVTLTSEDFARDEELANQVRAWITDEVGLVAKELRATVTVVEDENGVEARFESVIRNRAGGNVMDWRQNQTAARPLIIRLDRVPVWALKRHNMRERWAQAIVGALYRVPGLGVDAEERFAEVAEKVLAALDIEGLLVRERSAVRWDVYGIVEAERDAASDWGFRRALGRVLARLEPDLTLCGASKSDRRAAETPGPAATAAESNAAKATAA